MVAQLQIHPSLRMPKPVKRKRSNCHRHSVITASWLSSPPPPPNLVMPSLLYPPLIPAANGQGKQLIDARYAGAKAACGF